jgi:Lon protease-like protein
MKLKLPKIIPVFPLEGVIYFPKTNLPLNIFEERYLSLVDDCIKNDKLMGMVQSKKDTTEVYKVGCLGKISEYKRSKDKRLIINLTGICRFHIKMEINNDKLYREFEVDYEKFQEDTQSKNENKSEENIEKIYEKVKLFFKRNGLLLNWNEFEKLDANQKINTLAMIAPISNEEKQTLLESVDIANKSKTLSEIIEFYLHQTNSKNFTIQ